MATKAQAQFLPDPAFALRPALEPCTGCQQPVLVRLWSHETGWRELAAPENALLGGIHVCAERSAP